MNWNFNKQEANGILHMLIGCALLFTGEPAACFFAGMFVLRGNMILNSYWEKIEKVNS